jgi:hypothetical protein
MWETSAYYHLFKMDLKKIDREDVEPWWALVNIGNINTV